MCSLNVLSSSRPLEATCSSGGESYYFQSSLREHLQHHTTEHAAGHLAATVPKLPVAKLSIASIIRQSETSKYENRLPTWQNPKSLKI